jgi:hypothetical protein
MVMSILCWKESQISMEIQLVHQLINNYRKDVVIEDQQFKAIATSADYGIHPKI